jgi:hypothetical protein
MYRCEGPVVVEHGRCKMQETELVFDPPIPLPIAERTQHSNSWVLDGSSGIARFAVVRSAQALELTHHDETLHRSCKITLHRLFGSR